MTMSLFNDEETLTKLVGVSTFDSEGITKDNQHRLIYIKLGESTVENSMGLSVKEILDIFCENTEKALFVGFSIGYDMTMIAAHIVREMPYLWDRFKKTIGKDDKVVVFSYGEDTYMFSWLKSKHFGVYKKSKGAKKFKGTMVHDCFSLYGTSFLKALESWGIEIPEVVTTYKEKRANFTIEDFLDIKKYCDIEMQKLDELLFKTQTTANDLGYNARPFESPGMLATQLLKKYSYSSIGGNFLERLKKGEKIPEWQIASCNSYYGGIFDIFQTGKITGDIHYADIHSAYPAHFIHLPCFHNYEIQTINSPVREIYSEDNWIGYFEDIDFKKAEIYPLPYRENIGLVHYPRFIKGGYYTSKEIKPLLELNVIKSFKCSKLWVLKSESNCIICNELHQEIKRLYKIRNSSPETKLFIKLIINSIYGKLCQKVGKAPYQNYFLASFLTSSVRSQVYQEACKLPKSSLIAIATDSITSKEKLDVKYDDELGNWGYEKFYDVTMIQSGFYVFDIDTENPKPMTRGIASSEKKKLVERLQKGENYANLTFNQISFPPIGLALMLKEGINIIGNWVEVEKKIKLGNKKSILRQFPTKTSTLGYYEVLTKNEDYQDQLELGSIFSDEFIMMNNLKD